ncbi:PREDICTED: centrosome-associated protein 350-like [Priapulus caudatus]|uniref:Centrosome-associated protein 350-like n=1 Tax=Priapulus caudatus TaxID=37621 RepID=A0ABM1DUL8_PRICU|nr:PREDICTED: centrosome-associated protein 350-like [Priapulus caudatus]
MTGQRHLVVDPIVKVYRLAQRDVPAAAPTSDDDDDSESAPSSGTREVDYSVLNDPVPRKAHSLYRYNNYASPRARRSVTFSDASLNAAAERPLEDADSDTSESYAAVRRLARSALGDRIAATRYADRSSSGRPSTSPGGSSARLVETSGGSLPAGLSVNNWVRRGELSPTWRVPSSLARRHDDGGGGASLVVERRLDEKKLARLKRRIREQQQERQQREEVRLDEARAARRAVAQATAVATPTDSDATPLSSDDGAPSEERALVPRHDDEPTYARLSVRKVVRLGQAPSYRGFSDVGGHVVVTATATRSEHGPMGVEIARSLACTKSTFPAARYGKAARSQALPSRKVAPPVVAERPAAPKLSLITPSSWRLGQRAILRELGPSPRASPKKKSAKNQPLTKGSDDDNDGGTRTRNRFAAAAAVSDSDPSDVKPHSLTSDNDKSDDEPTNERPHGDKPARKKPSDDQPEKVSSSDTSLNADPHTDTDPPPDHFTETARALLDDINMRFVAEADDGEAVATERKPAAKPRARSKKRKAVKVPEEREPPAEKVRHYDAEKVRRYMARKRADRCSRLLEDRQQRSVSARDRKAKLQELARRQRSAARASARRPPRPPPATAAAPPPPVDDGRGSDDESTLRDGEATLVGEGLEMEEDAGGCGASRRTAGVLDDSDESAVCAPLADSAVATAMEVGIQTPLELLDGITRIPHVVAAGDEAPAMSDVVGFLRDADVAPPGGRLRTVERQEKMAAVLASAKSLQVRLNEEMQQLVTRVRLPCDTVATEAAQVAGGRGEDATDEIPGVRSVRRHARAAKERKERKRELRRRDQAFGGGAVAGTTQLSHSYAVPHLKPQAGGGSWDPHAASSSSLPPRVNGELYARPAGATDAVARMLGDAWARPQPDPYSVINLVTSELGNTYLHADGEDHPLASPSDVDSDSGSAVKRKPGGRSRKKRPSPEERGVVSETQSDTSSGSAGGGKKQESQPAAALSADALGNKMAEELRYFISVDERLQWLGTIEQIHASGARQQASVAFSNSLVHHQEALQEAQQQSALATQQALQTMSDAQRETVAALRDTTHEALRSQNAVARFTAEAARHLAQSLQQPDSGVRSLQRELAHGSVDTLVTSRAVQVGKGLAAVKERTSAAENLSASSAPSSQSDHSRVSSTAASSATLSQRSAAAKSHGSPTASERSSERSTASSRPSSSPSGHSVVTSDARPEERRVPKPRRRTLPSRKEELSERKVEEEGLAATQKVSEALDAGEEESIPEESIPEESIAEESIPEESIPGKRIQKQSIPEKNIREKSVREESIQEEAAAHESSTTTASESLPSRYESPSDKPVEVQQHVKATGDTLQVSFMAVLPSEAHRRNLQHSVVTDRRNLDRSAPAEGEDPSSIGSSALRIEDLAVPFGKEDSFARLTVEMVSMYMQDEQRRCEHQVALLKLRETALADKTKAEVAWLQMKKDKLRDKGRDEIMPIRHQQRALLQKLEHERAEMRRLQEANLAASQERQLLLRQQEELLKLQQTTRKIKHKLKSSLLNDGSGDSESVAMEMEDSTAQASGVVQTEDEVSLALDEESVEENVSTASKTAPSSDRSTHSTVREDIPAEFVEESQSKSISEDVKSEISSRGIEEEQEEDEELEGEEEDTSSPSQDLSVPSTSSVSRSEASVPLKLRKLQEQLNERYLTKREQKLRQKRHHVEKLLAWKQRLDQEDNRLKSLEKAVLKGSITKSSEVPADLLPSKVKSPVTAALTTALTDQVTTAADDTLQADQSTVIETEASPGGSSNTTGDTESGQVNDVSGDSQIVTAGDESVTPRAITRQLSDVQTTTDASIGEEVATPSKGSDSPSLSSHLPTRAEPAVSDYSDSFVSTPTTPRQSKPTSPLSSLSKRGRSAPGASMFSKKAIKYAMARHRDSDSGSDDSFSLPLSESMSDQSDVEGRIHALAEQLRTRKIEADRLKKEQKKRHREHLKAREDSLRKQIEAYDSYICQTRMELNRELAELSASSHDGSVKPKIKTPKVAELRRQKKVPQESAAGLPVAAASRDSSASRHLSQSGSESSIDEVSRTSLQLPLTQESVAPPTEVVSQSAAETTTPASGEAIQEQLSPSQSEPSVADQVAPTSPSTATDSGSSLTASSTERSPKDTPTVSPRLADLAVVSEVSLDVSIEVDEELITEGATEDSERQSPSDEPEWSERSSRGAAADRQSDATSPEASPRDGDASYAGAPYSEDLSDSSTVTTETQRSVKSLTPAVTPRESAPAPPPLPTQEEVRAEEEGVAGKRTGKGGYEEESFESTSPPEEESKHTTTTTSSIEEEVPAESSFSVEEAAAEEEVVREEVPGNKVTREEVPGIKMVREEVAGEKLGMPATSALHLDLTQLEPTPPASAEMPRDSVEAADDSIETQDSSLPKSPSPRSVSIVLEQSMTIETASETSLDRIIGAAAASVALFGEEPGEEEATAWLEELSVVVTGREEEGLALTTHAVQTEGATMIETLVDRLTNHLIDSLIRDSVAAVARGKQLTKSTPTTPATPRSPVTPRAVVSAHVERAMVAPPVSADVVAPDVARAAALPPATVAVAIAEQRDVAVAVAPDVVHVVTIAADDRLKVAPAVRMSTVVRPEAAVAVAPSSVEATADRIAERLIEGLIAESVSAICEIAVQQRTAGADGLAAFLHPSHLPAEGADTSTPGGAIYADVFGGSPALDELSVEYASPGHVPAEAPSGGGDDDATPRRGVEGKQERQVELTDSPVDAVARLEEGLSGTGVVSLSFPAAQMQHAEVSVVTDSSDNSRSGSVSRSHSLSPVQAEEAQAAEGHDEEVHRLTSGLSEGSPGSPSSPVPRPVSPVFGEYRSFTKEELSEKLSSLQTNQDAFGGGSGAGGEVLLDSDWLDDDFALIDGTFRRQAIPQKPPPPYTPPGMPQATAPPPDYQTARLELRRSHEPYYAVPRKWTEVAPLVEAALAATRDASPTVAAAPMPAGYVTDDEAGFDLVSRSRRAYKSFLFALVREVAADACAVAPPGEPWMKPRASAAAARGNGDGDAATRGELAKLLRAPATTTAAAAPPRGEPAGKWGSRKRDFVDAILVRELRGEEAEWLNYDDDELTVKTQLCDAVMASLVDDAVRTLVDATRRRHQLSAT